MRDSATRKADVMTALQKQGMYWLTTAEVGGRPRVIGVSGWWDGHQLVITTLGTSRSAKNMAMNPQVVLAHGDPSDAVVIEAGVIDSSMAEESAELAAGFKEAMGWDPREMDGWMFFRLRPTRIQAFRGYEEIEGREVMVHGRWVV